MDDLFWPETEVRLALRRRSRGLSVPRRERDGKVDIAWPWGVAERASEERDAHHPVRVRVVRVDLACTFDDIVQQSFDRRPTQWRRHRRRSQRAAGERALVERAALSSLLDLPYIGFVTVRPIPSAPIGRTILRPYKDKPTRSYIPSEGGHPVHLMGFELSARGLPFQQQEQAVGACATTAIWSAMSRVVRARVTALEIRVEILELRRRVEPHDGPGPATRQRLVGGRVHTRRRGRLGSCALTKQSLADANRRPAVRYAKAARQRAGQLRDLRCRLSAVALAQAVANAQLVLCAFLFISKPIP